MWWAAKAERPCAGNGEHTGGVYAQISIAIKAVVGHNLRLGSIHKSAKGIFYCDTLVYVVLQMGGCIISGK